jgi:hypothetical protein
MAVAGSEHDCVASIFVDSRVDVNLISEEEGTSSSLVCESGGSEEKHGGRYVGSVWQSVL